MSTTLLIENRKIKKRMKTKKVIFMLAWSLILLMACSNDDDDLPVASAACGRTGSLWIGSDIPVQLVEAADLPSWLQVKVGEWGEQADARHLKVFQGSLHGSTVYYLDDAYSSCPGCQFFHQDGRQVEFPTTAPEVLSLSQFTDWRCIYSTMPLKTGLSGVLHYATAASETYIESGQNRYYVWGYLNTPQLERLDGKRVSFAGFLDADITSLITDRLAGGTCYGLDATLIN